MAVKGAKPGAKQKEKARGLKGDELFRRGSQDAFL